MSDLLSIGASGVRSYQTSLTTTSENIANAGTAGYSRRVTTTREVATIGSVQGNVPNGMGVMVNGITRATDALRVAEARTAGADLARSQSSLVWLEKIESGLTSSKLDERMTAFFNSANAVAADPSATAPRTVMLQSAATLAQAFNTTAAAIDGAVADLDASADGAVGQLNQLTAGLAKVNAALSRSSLDTSGRASMLDERDRLLDSMSAIIDVSVEFDSAGRATVRGGAGGPLLVQGDQAAVATYARDEGATSFAVYGIDGVHKMSPTGGALAGIAEGAGRLYDAAAELNALAVEFADAVNAVQANGADLNGNAGGALFAATSARDIQLVMEDPRGIAAANMGAGNRDNGNLTNLANLRRDAGFESQITTLTTTNASALTNRRAVTDVQQTIRDNAVAARDSVSGVNLDEEAVDLIRFQQAFQASSRVIQVARETLQTIFDLR